jgi:hypothetical protein
VCCEIAGRADRKRRKKARKDFTGGHPFWKIEG